jgi:polyferredoxin
MDDLVRVEVGWVCFDVLFFISEFHFLFLLIFILFSRAMCNWCFPLRLYFSKFAILKMKTNKQQHNITIFFLRIQRIQSINKQTEYDNLILEQHILSKKN